MAIFMLYLLKFKNYTNAEPKLRHFDHLKGFWGFGVLGFWGGLGVFFLYFFSRIFFFGFLEDFEGIFLDRFFLDIFFHKI